MTTTCWKFGGDEVPDGYEGLSERLNFEVKGERWDLVPGEEIKFNDGRGKLLTSLIRKVSIRKETLDEYDVLNWQT